MTKRKKRAGLRSKPAKTTPISMSRNSIAMDMGRRIVAPSSVVTTALFPSTKMGNSFPCEGPNELIAHILLEYDQEVVWFKPQPEWITLIVGDKIVDHCPDFRCMGRDGKEYWLEIKPDNVAAQPEIQARTKAAEAYAAERGMSYRMLTASQMKSGNKLFNAQLICRHLRDRVTDDQKMRVLSELRMGPKSVRDLADSTGAALGVMYAIVLHLASRHVLNFDMEKRLTVDGVVSAIMPQHGEAQ